MSSGGHGGGGLPGLSIIEHMLHDAHFERGTHIYARPLIIAFVLANVLFFFIAPYQALHNYSFLIFFSPLWAPYILVKFAHIQFLLTQKIAYNATQNHVLLELRLPRDTMKTVTAMESVIAAMHIGPGEAIWWKRSIMGNTRPWYSLEIASIGGRVHFYIWTRDVFRRAIESALYAQYPGMELIEVEDYSRLVDPAHHPYQVVGFDYEKTQPQPLPIRTYVEFGLDKPSKPEEQVDPLAQVIELMGSLGPKEQLWIQIIIRTHKSEKYAGKFDSKGKPMKNWKDEAHDLIETLRAEATPDNTYVDPATGKTIKAKGFPNPTKGQMEKMAAIDRNVGKLAFDTGIRALYTAPEDVYQGITGAFLVSLFKAFNSEDLNSLSVGPVWSNYIQGYPWEDKDGHHEAHALHKMVEMYRRRAFFHPPYVGNWAVMSTEELATLFHVPSATIATPSLPRIQSQTGGAPSNLPT